MPDHLHERHRRRAEGRRARPALPRRPAPAGRALARRAPRRARVVHRGQRLEQVGAQRLHRAVAARRGGAAARRALRPRASAWRSSPRSRSRCCAWPPPSTASSPSAPSRDRRRRCAAWSPPARRSTPRSCARGTRPPACGCATATARPRPGRSPACRWTATRVPGSMGRPLPGIDAWVEDGELVVDPATVPDLLPRLPRRHGAERAVAHRRPRDPGRRRLPVLRGPHRRRHHLGRLPHRPVRGRVGARRAPRGGRGRGGRRPRRRARRRRARRRRAARRPRPVATSLARELQDHVKAQTAPYKYPRIVEFAAELPKTASGKVRRAALQGRVGRERRGANCLIGRGVERATDRHAIENAHTPRCAATPAVERRRGPVTPPRTHPSPAGSARRRRRRWRR